MHRPRMASKPTAPVEFRTPAELLAAARKQPAAVYLVIGEPFQTELVARSLVEVLVPADRRSFHVEKYDGRTTSIGVVLDSLRMRGFFGGTKLVWVREPTLFISGEKRSDLTAAMFAAWADERPAEAAEKLLTLAAMANWKQDAFEALDGATLTQSDASDLLGRTLEPAERPLLTAIRNFCTQNGLAVGNYRDESGVLEDFLRAGMPADSVLLFTASAVDRRKRIFKLVREAGAVLELALEHERSGALSAESIDQLVRETLARHGKKIAPAALALIRRRAGSDAATLAMELEKLVLYAGDAENVTESDVRESFRDIAESWVFDFTRALAQREAPAAIALLRRLILQGEPPLRLLALIAREIRLLLTGRDLIAGPLASKWNTRVQFNFFRDHLLPLIGPEERAAIGNLHPFVLYLCLQNASRLGTAALQRALLRLQEIDIRLKSSAADAGILLERFVLDLCGGQAR